MAIQRVAVAFLICCGTVLPGSGQTLGGCRVFPSDNIWNTPVDTLPVAALSRQYIETMGATTGAHPDFGHSLRNGIPYDAVPANQPKVPVNFRYESDEVKYPLPDKPTIEGGDASTGDRHVLLLQSGACVLYELFSVTRTGDGKWQAGSGAVYPLNSNRLRPEGATSADAAGLPILPGLVRFDEVQSGKISHALRFTAAATQKAHIWPARHDASSHTETKYPPMGQRFRLRKDFDVTPFPPHLQVILQALKTYGMFLADTGGPWFISGVPDTRWDDDELHQLTRVLGKNFEAVDESGLMSDPNSAQVRSH
jgi:hypothetical protein